MQDVLQKVQLAFVAAFDIAADDVQADSTPEDIKGWDSLGHGIMVSELEEIFNISFDIDEVLDMEDVPAILSIVQSKISAA
jgi:acyl carrier protein